MIALLLSIIVLITDSTQRQLITSAEVRSIVSDVTSPSQCQDAEDRVESHPMVLRANCWFDIRHNLHVRLTQREPVIRVITHTECYWVDAERTRIAIKPGADVHTLDITGSVGQKAATTDLFDLAMLIRQSEFFAPLVREIRVMSPNNVQVILTSGKRLLLGQIGRNTKHQLARFERLYKRAFMMEEPNCKEFDLRFRGQVITR